MLKDEKLIKTVTKAFPNLQEKITRVFIKALSVKRTSECTEP